MVFIEVVTKETPSRNYVEKTGTRFFKEVRRETVEEDIFGSLKDKLNRPGSGWFEVGIFTELEPSVIAGEACGFNALVEVAWN